MPWKNMPVVSEYFRLSLINHGLLCNSSINFRSGRKEVEELFSRTVRERYMFRSSFGFLGLDYQSF